MLMPLNSGFTKNEKVNLSWLQNVAKDRRTSSLQCAELNQLFSS
jgi:hypothetical protein